MKTFSAKLTEKNFDHFLYESPPEIISQVIAEGSGERSMWLAVTTWLQLQKTLLAIAYKHRLALLELSSQWSGRPIVMVNALNVTYLKWVHDTSDQIKQICADICNTANSFRSAQKNIVPSQQIYHNRNLRKELSEDLFANINSIIDLDEEYDDMKKKNIKTMTKYRAEVQSNLIKWANPDAFPKPPAFPTQQGALPALATAAPSQSSWVKARKPNHLLPPAAAIRLTRTDS